MSNTNYKQFTEKLRPLSQKKSWKKSLTFLFFVVLAIIFWVMQVYSQKIKMAISIPIKYTNIADDISFEDKLPDEITVEIKDYGSSIIKYATKRKDSLELDLSTITKDPASKRTLQGQDLEQLIRTKLLSNSELIGFHPTYISLEYNRVDIRKLPVLFDGFISLASGYQLDGDISIYPDSVIAYGTKAALDTINFAYTIKDTISNINSNKKIDVPLDKPKGISYKPNKVEVSVLVDKFIVKELKVPIECIGLPNNLTIKFFPSEVTVPVFVSLKRYNLIESSDFKIQVDYKDIKDMQGSSIQVRIIEAPDFVRTKLPEPSEVEFVLEQK